MSAFSKRHIPELDGLRGIAIGLVLLFHFRNLLTQTPIDLAWMKLSAAGWCGVDLFFVLSGFLITGILIDAKGSKDYFRAFYLRRTLRIFPLYFAFLAFYFLFLNPPRIVVENAGWYFFFLSNYFIAGRGTFPDPVVDPTWSLAVEEQFYLVWPLFIAMVSGKDLRRIAGGIILGALVFRGAWAVTQGSSLMAYVSLPARMDTLAMGALAAIAVRTPGSSWDRRSRRALIPLLIAAAVSFAWGCTYTGLHLQTLGYTVLAGVFGAVLLRALAPEPTLWKRILRNGFLRTLGKYSFGIYLFHQPIQRLLLPWLSPLRGPLTWAGSEMPWQTVWYLMASSATVATAALSFHFYESFFLGLKAPRYGAHAELANRD